MRSDAEDQGHAWAVVYGDGMSLTTASEQTARTLADALRQRGSDVTVERVDNATTHPAGVAGPEPPSPAGRPMSHEPVTRPIPAPEPVPDPEPEPPAAPDPAGEIAPPEPAREPEPAEPAREPALARAVSPARRRGLVRYVLAAACIVVAAALADHWNVLPRIGASTGPAQVSNGSHSPQLLPPLGQPPVIHFGH